MTRRVALYARYSSDLQSQASIEDQIRVCQEWAEQSGFEVLEVFSDYALSGGSLKTRPGILALLENVKAGRFDYVVAEALDRISRDQEDVAAIYKRLTHTETKLVTLAEGEINELHVGLKGTMNALFLKDLAAKTKRGQRGRVEAGKIPGGKSYGYKIVRRITDSGDLAKGEREIDAGEAAIIRQIFDDYAKGLSPRVIAAQLNHSNVPGPRGGPWNASTINGSRQRRNGILNNELYLGRITYNRQRFVKDPETGKRLSRPNPESEWVTREVPHLRIIDDPTWDAVQARKSRYASQAGNKRQTKKKLLSGLIRCGSCGGGMTIVNRERYSCSARRERGTCSSPTSIAAITLETRVLAGLKEILLGQDVLIAEFTAAYKQELNRLRRTQKARVDQTQKELQKVERSIARCLDFITEGDGDPRSVRQKLTELEAQKKELNHQLNAKPNEPNKIVLHPNMAELYRRKVQDLQTLLTDETTRTEAMEIIRGLIDRIEVSPGPTRGNPIVELHGILAHILVYATGPKQKNAAADASGVCRVLLVAGVGFEPTTFRL